MNNELSERRIGIHELREDIGEIRETITELREKVILLESYISHHIENDKRLEPKLQEILVAFDRSKFALYMLSYLSALMAGMWAIYKWAHDHLRWLP